MSHKTVITPKLYVTKTGKKYFLVNKKRVFISSKLSKKEITSIYRILMKQDKKKKKNYHTNNSSKAVINITNAAPSSRRRARRSKASKSTSNEGNKVSVSGGDPKDSGDKDLINSLINENNKNTEKIERQLQQPQQTQPLQLQQQQQPPALPGPNYTPYVVLWHSQVIKD